MQVPQQAPASSGEVVEIGANSEWRVEVGFDETLTVKASIHSYMQSTKTY